MVSRVGKGVEGIHTAIRAFIRLTGQSVHCFIGPANEVMTPRVFMGHGTCCIRPRTGRLLVMALRFYLRLRSVHP